MSYYSEFRYGARDHWFMSLYYDYWFKDLVDGPILDVGCAAGDFIAVNPQRIEGFDVDDANLQKAKERGFKVCKLDIEKGEMSKLGSGAYTGVLASQVIEHLDHPLEFLKEIKRILKPGGKAVISTPHIPYALKTFWDDYTHKRPFTKKSLRMIAHDAGFEKIVIYGDFKCYPGLGRMIRLLHLTPDAVTKVQNLFGIRGPSLIMELRK